jgi:hypothetical protein
MAGFLFLQSFVSNAREPPAIRKQSRKRFLRAATRTAQRAAYLQDSDSRKSQAQ